MVQSKNSLSREQVKRYNKKFSSLSLANESEVKQLMRIDPSIFAFFMFKDESGKRLKVYDYQDLIMNDTSKRVAVCISRQTGKSVLAVVYAFWYIFYHAGATVLVVSQTEKQSQELLHKLRRLISRSPMYHDIKSIMKVGGDSKEAFEVYADDTKTITSRIISLPSTSVRGYSADLVIADEIAFWKNPDEDFSEGLLPTVTHTKGKILMLSTPKGKRGPLWAAANDTKNVWSFYHYNWRVCPDIDINIIKNDPNMTEYKFLQEYEAMFTVNQAAYFSENEVLHNVKEITYKTHTTNSVVLGVDLGQKNDNSVLYAGTLDVKEFENQGRRQTLQRVIVTLRREYKLGTSYSVIAQDILRLSQSMPIQNVIYDATGVGAAFGDNLRDLGIRCQPVLFSIGSKLDIYSNLKMLFESNSITIPKEKKLIDQLLLFEYEETASGRLKLHHPEGQHDDECDALALMAWGIKRPGYVMPYIKYIDKSQSLNNSDTNNNTDKVIDGTLKDPIIRRQLFSGGNLYE